MPRVARQNAGGALDAAATEESWLRWRLAREMVARCPVEWNLDMALTGSASRGWADTDSDIELNAWGQTLPTPDARAVWLQALGATEIALVVEVTDDGTLWDRWRYHDIWVEAGWQPLAALDASLRGTLRGDLLDHAHLMLAEVVSHALPLRVARTPTGTATTDPGALHAWRQRLASYPDTLRERLIASTLTQWDSPYTAITRWSPVRRGQLLTVAEELVRDVHAVLRLLFALNREWEPDWKWIARLSARLAVKPERLTERIGDCFGPAPAPERMCIATLLILDTLALLPPSDAIERIRANLHAGLNTPQSL